MKKVVATSLLILLFLLAVAPMFSAEEEPKNLGIGAKQYESAYRYNIQGWIYTHITGEPYERGYQHGYLLSEEIVDMLNRWSHTIHNYPTLQPISARLSEERYHKVAQRWWEFCKMMNYRWYWDKYPDEYKDEIRGIADGATVRGGTLFSNPITFEDILAMNQMYEFMSKLTRMKVGIHPLRTFFYQLQQEFPAFANLNINTLIENFLQQEDAHHCNGFIATGNATTDGQMIVTHSTICGGTMWWWNYYISLRWNVILDILPTEGERVIISTSPGLIWSDEDYYQNGDGIVFLETTVPQGLFDFKGLPLSIRARTAVQYSESIDDVIYYLRHRNDGSMNAVWNIGDAKTGEIARLDLGWKAYEVWRTFDGYYWSANNPMNIRVRLEKLNVEKLLRTFTYKLLGIPGFGFHSLLYRPETRDIKYEELGDRYYGKIDTDIVKEITMTPPISDWITDIKLTNSDLLQHNGLWTFFGNPFRSLNYTSFDTQDFQPRKVYPTGWVQLYALSEKPDFELEKEPGINPGNAEEIWSYNTTKNSNYFCIQSTFDEDTFYSSTSAGDLFALNKTKGAVLWKKQGMLKPTKPILFDELLLIGHHAGVTAYDRSGTLRWENTDVGSLVSQPTICGNTIVVGSDDGTVYGISPSTGAVRWSLSFSGEPYVSSYDTSTVVVTNATSCSLVDVNSQEIIWTYVGDGPITSPFISDDSAVYGSSWDTNFVALNASTGRLKWSCKLGWGVQSSACMYDEMVFVACMDNNVYALNKSTGDIEWVYSSNGAFQADPCVFGDYVFAGCDDGRLYAINHTTGVGAWSFTPRFSISDLYNFKTTPLLSDTVVSEGIVLTAANGIIYGLDAQTEAIDTSPPSDDDEPGDEEQNDDSQSNDDSSNGSSDSPGSSDEESLELRFGLLGLIGLLCVVVFVFFVILFRRWRF